MRILIVPVFNYPNQLDADSIWNITGDWARRLAEAMPDAAIYRLVPELLTDRLRKFRYVEKQLHPRVHDLKVPMFARYDLEEANIDPNVYMQFHPVLGDLSVDAVIATSSIKLLGVKRMIEASGGRGHSPAFFAFDMLIRGLGSNEVSQVTRDEMMMQAAGQALSYNLVESPKCQRIGTGIARRHLAPSQVNRIHDNSFMAFSGFASDEVEALPLEEREEKFTVIARGRLTSSKNIDQILGLYNARYSAGHEIQVVVTSGDLGMPKSVKDELTKNKAIDFKNCETKAEANEVMRKSHAFVLWSSHELFCVSLWEMFAAGLIGIVKKADWHKGLLPPKYPFVFSSTAEAYTMLAELQENYDHWVEELAWVKDWVIDRYAYKNTTARTSVFVREKIEKHWKTPRDWLVEMFAEAEPDAMTLEEGFQYVIDTAELGGQIVRGGNPTRVHQSVGPREVAHALVAAGYVEDLEAAAPTFARQVEATVAEGAEDGAEASTWVGHRSSGAILRSIPGGDA